MSSTRIAFDFLSHPMITLRTMTITLRSIRGIVSNTRIAWRSVMICFFTEGGSRREDS